MEHGAGREYRLRGGRGGCLKRVCVKGRILNARSVFLSVLLREKGACVHHGIPAPRLHASLVVVVRAPRTALYRLLLLV